MSFFNDAQKDALLTGRYICSKCGARMQFEDEWEDILVCLELQQLHAIHDRRKRTGRDTAEI